MKTYTVEELTKELFPTANPRSLKSRWWRTVCCVESKYYESLYRIKCIINAFGRFFITITRK